MPQHTLLYVADPMCSWCWGFWPVMESVHERFGSRAPVSVIMGGLAPGAAEPMDDRAKAVVREHWDHVHEASGQPFDYAFFDRKGFSYTSEPSSRAVVTARQLDTEKAIPFLAHLHAAFYRDNQDVTDSEVLCNQAVSFGFEREEFSRHLGSDATRETTQQDFALARELGVRGFPSLIGHDGQSLTAITMGYQPLNNIGRAIDAWLGTNDAVQEVNQER